MLRLPALLLALSLATLSCGVRPGEAPLGGGRLELRLVSREGQASGPALASHSSLEFPVTRFGVPSRLVLEARNVGPGPLVLRDVALGDAAGSGMTLAPVQACAPRPGSAWTVPPGGCSRLSVEFVAEQPGVFTDVLAAGDGVQLTLSARAERGPPRWRGPELGVTDTEVFLGMPAVFSGPSRHLGLEVWRGAQAAFLEANAAGGVHGRQVRLVTADDGYEAERAIPAVQKLATDEEVFALFAPVGTPTLARSLPVITRYAGAERLFVFAPFTGAQLLREGPAAAAVLNVRASYRQETEAMVDALVAAGKRRVGVFLQDDAYGKSGLLGVKSGLRNHDLRPVAVTTYVRGVSFETDTRPQVQQLLGADAQAIIVVGTYQAAAALIRDARAAGFAGPIFNVSFVGAHHMLKLLREEEQRSGQRLTEQLYTSQVVPPPGDTSVPLVRDWRAAMERFRPQAPEGVPPWESKRPWTSCALEGYLDARAFLAVLERTGRHLTRERFVAAAEQGGPLEVGLGVPLEFGANRPQALDAVWMTRAEGAEWRLVDDLVTALK